MLGEILKDLRIKKDLTQQQVADLLNINRVTYTQYELNKRDPDTTTLSKLADFFGVTTDVLLGRESKLLVPSNGIITNDDLRKVGITSEDIAIIKVTRKEGLTAEDIQYFAEISKRYKPKTPEPSQNATHKKPPLFISLPDEIKKLKQREVDKEDDEEDYRHAE